MYECPLQKNYTYRGKCQIETCQFNNPKTKTGCIDRDISSTTSQIHITDVQLLNLKILPKSKEFETKNFNENFAAYARKKAEISAKSNMLLYLFCLWIKSTLKPSPRFQYAGGVPYLDLVLNSFPLNQIELSFEPWMLYYVANPKAYIAFIESQKRSQKERLKVHNLLCLTPGKHKQLASLLANYNKSFQKPKQNKTRRAK